MAREKKVTEEKLQTLIQNWNEKEIGELAQILAVDEGTVNSWAARLRKSMKKQGMTDELIKKILPAKRKVTANVFDLVVKKLQAGEQAPKGKGGRPRKVRPAE
jgi:transposase